MLYHWATMADNIWDASFKIISIIWRSKSFAPPNHKYNFKKSIPNIISQSSSVVERLAVTLKVVSSNPRQSKTFFYNWEKKPWKHDDGGALFWSIKSLVSYCTLAGAIVIIESMEADSFNINHNAKMMRSLPVSTNSRSKCQILFCLTILVMTFSKIKVL